MSTIRVSAPKGALEICSLKPVAALAAAVPTVPMLVSAQCARGGCAVDVGATATGEIGTTRDRGGYGDRTGACTAR